MVLLFNLDDVVVCNDESLETVSEIASSKVSISLPIIDTIESNSYSKFNLYHSSCSTTVNLDSIVVGESRDLKRERKTIAIISRKKYIANMDFEEMNRNTALVKRSIQYHARCLLVSMILVKDLLNLFTFSLDNSTKQLVVSESHSIEKFKYSKNDGTPLKITQTTFDSKTDILDKLNICPDSILESKNIQFQVAC